MPNQKVTTSRALAFWLGLTLHLALGAALYHQVSSEPVVQTPAKQNTPPVAPAPAKP